MPRHSDERAAAGEAAAGGDVDDDEDVAVGCIGRRKHTIARHAATEQNRSLSAKTPHLVRGRLSTWESGSGRADPPPRCVDSPARS
jgi:hypothetical protein